MAKDKDQPAPKGPDAKDGDLSVSRRGFIGGAAGGLTAAGLGFNVASSNKAEAVVTAGRGAATGTAIPPSAAVAMTASC